MNGWMDGWMDGWMKHRAVSLRQLSFLLHTPLHLTFDKQVVSIVRIETICGPPQLLLTVLQCLQFYNQIKSNQIKSNLLASTKEQ